MEKIIELKATGETCNRSHLKEPSPIDACYVLRQAGIAKQGNAF